jgi:hypothetical protein
MLWLRMAGLSGHWEHVLHALLLLEFLLVEGPAAAAELARARRASVAALAAGSLPLPGADCRAVIRAQAAAVLAWLDGPGALAAERQVRAQRRPQPSV